MLTNLQSTIVNIINTSLQNGCNFTKEDFSLINGESEFEIFEEFKQQAVLTLTTPIYHLLPLSNSCKTKWEDFALKTIASGMKIQKLEDYTCKVLKQNNIDCVVLKGSASASYYPSGIYRTFGDVDVLVNPKDFEIAASVLENNDFTRLTGNYDDPRNTSFSKNGIVVELHHSFFDKDWLDNMLFDSISKSKTYSINGLSLPILPDFENGIILLDHAKQHLDGDLGMRQLIDWIEFVRSVCNNDFWNNEFSNIVEKSGLTKLAKALTMIGKKYFSLPSNITWCDDCSQETADELFVFILSNGNFGNKHKGDQRVVSVASYKNDFISWLKYLQNTGLSHWKLAQKVKILRPFAWIYQIFRYINRIFKDNVLKHFFINKQWKEISKRKKLFKNLDL